MTEYRRTATRSVCERVYRAMLRLYPAQFRAELGDAMLEFFRDRLADPALAGNWRARFRIRVAAFADVAASLVPAHLDNLQHFFSRTAERRATVARSSHIQLFRRQDRMWPSILQDIREGVGALFKQPALAVVIVMTLALGIGANVAIFSVVRGVLLRPLPFRDPSGIVRVEHAPPYQSVSELEFLDYKQDARSFSRLAAIVGASLSFTGDAITPVRVRGVRVSDGFFDILGVRPLLGQTLRPSDDLPGAAPAVVLSYGLWVSHFGADSGIVGRSVMANGAARTVVGVMPEHFGYPDAEVNAWMPLQLNRDSVMTRNNHFLQLVGRLAAGTTPAQAQAEITAMARQFKVDFPDIYSSAMIGRVQPVADVLIGDTRRFLLTLSGAVAFVLLIACLNVTNLLLARGEARRHELAIRTAMGATRGRLIRQLFTETAVFALLGGVVGIAAGWMGVRVLLRLAPSNIPRLNEITVDPLVLGFAIAVTVAAAALFGVLPALRGSASDEVETLRAGARSIGPGGGRSMRRGLVVAEIALTVMTLTAAGLMLRSLDRLQSSELGMDPSSVLAAQVNLPEWEFEGAQSAQFYETLLQRLALRPGVASAAAVADLPVADGNSNWSILIDGQPRTTVADAPTAMPQQITPDYFATMRIPVIRGRAFTRDDREGAPLVAIVNETMERKYWAARGAVGGTIAMYANDSPPVTIVGVVADTRHGGFGSEVPPTMYFPHQQAGTSAYYTPVQMNVVVRATHDPLALVETVKSAVQELAPNAPVERVESMERIVALSVASRSFTTQLLALFALVGLLLAAIGIYGLISYGVVQRRAEIGVRLALGSGRQRVLRLFLREGATLAAVGLCVGAVGAVALHRVIASMLVDTALTDGLTLLGVTFVLFAAAMFASWLPAYRATLIEPVGALRGD